MDHTSQVKAQNDKLLNLLAPVCGCARCNKPGRHTITLKDRDGNPLYWDRPLCWSCWSTSRREMGIGV